MELSSALKFPRISDNRGRDGVVPLSGPDVLFEGITGGGSHLSQPSMEAADDRATHRVFVAEGALYESDSFSRMLITEGGGDPEVRVHDRHDRASEKLAAGKEAYASREPTNV